MDNAATLQEGIEHQSAGRYIDAAEAYRRVLEVDPSDLDAIYLSGVLALQLQDFDAAGAFLMRSAAVRPWHFDSVYFLGLALLFGSQPARAVECFRKATMIADDSYQAYYHLAKAECHVGALLDASESVLRALSLDPERPGARDLYLQLIASASYQADSEAVHRLCAGIFSIRPSISAELLYLATVTVFNGGYHALCMRSFREILERFPDYEIAHAAMIDALFLHAPNQEDAFRELDAWQRQHEEPLLTEDRAWPNEKNPERKLRIGFLSLHLINANTFLSVWPGWFEGYAPEKFEIVAYVDEASQFDTVRQFTNDINIIRQTDTLSDEDLARLIRSDGIDILVDLYGRGPANRFGVLARKPAPLQATWGPIQSGMVSVDYFFSDRHVLPARMFHRYREKIVWLPESYVAWVPPEDVPIERKTAGTAYPVAFGTFNREVKFTPETLDIWAQTMIAVPEAAFIFKGGAGDRKNFQSHLMAEFERRGVDPARLAFIGGSGRSEHLDAYGNIDIQLDTVPEQGGITTLESLWCGVPVVTWKFDDRILSRTGASIYGTLGMKEFVAEDVEDYVRIARGLASDRERLQRLRAELRGLLRISPLLDLGSYNDAIQAAFIEMWRRYCANEPPSHLDLRDFR